MSARSSSEPVARTKRSSSEAVAQSRKLKVTQVRSVIHRPKDQKSTVRRLGLITVSLGFLAFGYLSGIFSRSAQKGEAK